MGTAITMTEMKRKRFWMKVALFAALLAAWPTDAAAMHITEGILPASWAGIWFVVAAPFVFLGLRNLRIRSARSIHVKPLIGLTGAAVFVISCMPIPVPVVGATAHPCGVGLAAILMGPTITALIASVALTLQALFLAHGGLSTLGANTMSMGVIGGFTGYAVFHMGKRLGAGTWASAFAAGLIADWATYSGTALFMSLALARDGEWFSMFLAIMAAFAPTQIPLGVLEGFITAGAYRFIMRRRPEVADVDRLGVVA
ncbi:MAG: energy-coupling factor ABC transporter permease [Nitrospinota bacterium]|nr:energy-coupling factor ABC transporter permease [Nitrospinota bacterium]